MSYLLPSHTITLDAAMRDLVHGTPRARAMAAHALGDIPEDASAEIPRVLDALVIALGDERPEVRTEAAASLGTASAAAKDSRGVPRLIAAIDDLYSPVRQAAIIALGSIGDASAFAPLLAALQSEAPDVRYQAVSSLAEIDPARAYEPVVAALGDADPQVVGAAAIALGAIGDGRAAGHLSRLLEHESAEVAFEAACALAELGDARGIPLLQTNLANTAQGFFAIEALSKLGSDAAGNALATALQHQRGDLSLVAISAAGALVGEPWNPARPPGELAHAQQVLLKFAASWRLQRREAALGQLERIGGVWAISPLQAFARTWRGWFARHRLAQVVAALSAATDRAAPRELPQKS